MKIADRGKRAIMVAGLRLTTETAMGPLRLAGETRSEHP